MFAHAAPERDRSDDHRQSQANLVDDRLAEQTSRGGQQAEQHGGGNAVHGAQAREAHRQPVEP